MIFWTDELFVLSHSFIFTPEPWSSRQNDADQDEGKGKGELANSCLSLKGALYRIWCGVNRLGDSGLKVV